MIRTAKNGRHAPRRLTGKNGSHANRSDEEILEAIARRDEAALVELHRRYSHYIRWLAQSIVHNEAVAEDLSQETLLQIWEQAGNFSSSKGKAVNWLATIAKRRAIDRLRERQAYGRALDRLEISLTRQKSTTVRQSLDREIASKDLRQFLGRLLSELPPNQKRVIELAFLSDYSQREIARHTRTPVGTVKTRYELGLRKLQRRIRSLNGSI